MARKSHTEFPVSILEKLVVNWALPSDFVYWTIRSKFTGEYDQTPIERVRTMWSGKIRKYQKLLRIKEEHDGIIPPEYQNYCGGSPCGYVRVFLARHHR